MSDLEDRLWRAANKLRGRMDAAAYKHVVLAILFLRFAGSGALRIPAAARWNRLRAGRLDAAFEALEKANPRLAGVLPRGLDEVDGIDDLLVLLSDIEPSTERDSLGGIYEYFLGRFARAEGRRGGQFYTPACLVRLLVAMLGPMHGTVYDPCCGTGGMFVQAGLREGVFGQESNPQTWRLARMNLALHGIEADLGPRAGDTFDSDLHTDRRADFVLANPPFNQSDWRVGSDDDRWPHGVPPDSNANFAWIQQVLARLAPGGAAGVLLANGSLSATKAGEGAIRRSIVEAGWVDCIVALPSQLFFATPIPATAWILRRDRPDRTLFIDARDLGRMTDRAHRELTDADLERIAGCYRAYADEAGFSAVATLREIEQRRFLLSPGLYVERAGHRPRPEDVKSLVRRWDALATESEELTRAIRELDLGIS